MRAQTIWRSYVSYTAVVAVVVVVVVAVSLVQSGFDVFAKKGNKFPRAK